ncbi:hypothetical protein PV327_001022 [Microctonus hyperodae]|uniref:Factor VIII intron 22 protein n=1 Tax=Microctonus hyperodae TaxID=165561 RepID=A0AA39G7D3_MICHY|nr:hypothetical protein PV327_001022 [Microctonus hyperodae]
MESSSVSQTSIISDLVETSNFFPKYHSINNKLKKRFMRSPKVPDASDEFLSLASQCEQKKSWYYAGLCYLAASRCYHKLGNTGSEMNNLVRAGKYFLFVNKENVDVGCPSIGLADFQAASSCFCNITKNNKNKSIHDVIIAGCIIELAQALGPTPDGQELLKKAIKYYPTVQFIDIFISYCLKQDDYTMALNIVTNMINLIEMIGTLSQYYLNFLHKTEVTRLMLILMVQQTSQHFSSALVDVVEKYTGGIVDSVIGAQMSEDEYLALQSLIFACRSHNNQALLEIEGELWKYIDTNQKDFLRTLIQIMIDK